MPDAVLIGLVGGAFIALAIAWALFWPRKKDSIDRLAEKAVTVRVNGEDIQLRLPSSKDTIAIQRFSIMHLSSEAEDQSEVANMESMYALVGLCLSATVVGRKRTPEEWFTLIRSGEKTDAELGTLVREATRLCGFQSVMRTAADEDQSDVTDHIQEVGDQIGDGPFE